MQTIVHDVHIFELSLSVRARARRSGGIPAAGIGRQECRPSGLTENLEMPTAAACLYTANLYTASLMRNTTLRDDLRVVRSPRVRLRQAFGEPETMYLGLARSAMMG